MIDPRAVRWGYRIACAVLCVGLCACSRGSSGVASSAKESGSQAQSAPLAAGSADTDRRSREPEPDSEVDPNARQETAILAGGCFWGMEELLRKIPGVLGTDVGYVGGTTPDPDYEDVHGGTTGHAEAVRVKFDPTKLSYENLLEKWYFRMHDPTTKNRQGNDVGSQYRSAIFFTSAEQQAIATRVKDRVNKSGKWSDPIVTEIVAAGPFTLAEDYHQDYLQVNPDGYTCHFLRE